MGFGVGSIGLGIYLGTLYGMIVKYYKVKKFFRENDTQSQSQPSTLNLNDEL